MVGAFEVYGLRIRVGGSVVDVVVCSDMVIEKGWDGNVSGFVIFVL